MKLEDVKLKIRRELGFVFTFCALGHYELLLTARKIDGLSSYAENILLFECAANGYGEGTVVEIGCYKGKITISLAMGSKSKKREKIITVDPLEDPDIKASFLANVKKSMVSEYIIADFRRSEAAAVDFDSNIRLLFIDGSHRYEDVKKDIILWSKYIIDGGLLVLHDYYPQNSRFYQEGINRVANELLLHSNEFIFECLLDSSLVFSKGKSKSQVLFKRFDWFNSVRNRLKLIIDNSLLRIAKR